jgi:hypothetical protein
VPEAGVPSASPPSRRVLQPAEVRGSVGHDRPYPLPKSPAPNAQRAQAQSPPASPHRMPIVPLERTERNWVCSACTLVNHHLDARCVACRAALGVEE